MLLPNAATAAADAATAAAAAAAAASAAATAVVFFKQPARSVRPQLVDAQTVMRQCDVARAVFGLSWAAHIF